MERITYKQVYGTLTYTECQRVWLTSSRTQVLQNSPWLLAICAECTLPTMPKESVPILCYTDRTYWWSVKIITIPVIISRTTKLCKKLDGTFKQASDTRHEDWKHYSLWCKALGKPWGENSLRFTSLWRVYPKILNNVLSWNTGTRKPDRHTNC